MCGNTRLGNWETTGHLSQVLERQCPRNRKGRTWHWGHLLCTPTPSQLSLHHYLSNVSQLRNPGLECRDDYSIYYGIIGGLITHLYAWHTWHLLFTWESRTVRRRMSPGFPVCHIFCLQSLIPMIEGTCRIYIYLYYVDTTMAATPPLFDSAGRSLKSCLKLFYRIPTALYFFRESL